MSTQQPRQQPDWRKQEFKYDQFFFQVTFGVIVIILAALIGFALFPEDMGYRSNLYTTAVGVLVTVSVLDLLANRRDEKQAVTRLRETLIIRLGSRVNTITRSSAEELDQHGWLSDGTLRGINLQGADLTEVEFTCADLQGANFSVASLAHASLMCADLRGAIFSNGTLYGAACNKANFEGANLFQANAQATGFYQANFKNADLTRVIFDTTTFLPDGTHWTPGTDMTRFTDPNHINFWRSDDPCSPAYEND